MLRSVPWFWLSFADPKLPEGEQFLGVAIVCVDDAVIRLMEHFDTEDRIDLLRERGQDSDVPFYVATLWAAFLGLNPGGEAQGWEIPPKAMEVVPENMRARLLTREEAESIG